MIVTHWTECEATYLTAHGFLLCRYGADSLRLYEMFMGPLRETKVHLLCWGGLPPPFLNAECFYADSICGYFVMACLYQFPCNISGMYLNATIPLQVWNTNSVEGVHRFLTRAWRLLEHGLHDDDATMEQMKVIAH